MHPLILLVTLIILLHAGLAVPIDFENAREFYHELGSEWTLRILLNDMLLTCESVEILGHLLANKRFNIQNIYNLTCSSITSLRAGQILDLVRNRKDLEMRLLGPTCLSPVIIDQRRKRGMWPPSGFPLLVNGFIPHWMSMDDIKAILGEALNRPEWWQSLEWIPYAKWDEMDNLSFWRMIPPSWYRDSELRLLYLWRTLSQINDQPTCRDLEELLMKSIRIPDFDNNWGRVFKEKDLDEKRLLEKFSHLKDPWSIKALGILEKIYSKGWRERYLRTTLLDSGLLQFASWKDGPIDMATATNDIFELMIKALDNTLVNNAKKIFEQLLISFFNNIPDWSIVRPVLLGEAVTMINVRLGSSLVEKYVDKMLRNTLAFPVLPGWLLAYSTNLKIHKSRSKLVTPLRRLFIEKTRERSLHLSCYVKSLYQVWVRSKRHWPGLIDLHERVKGYARRVFKPSERKDGTYDPDIDQTYSDQEWNLAFSSVKFQVDHDIPSNAIPSICFLQALLHYHKNGFMNWSMFKTIEECSFPEKDEERFRYESALKGANFQFFVEIPLLPTVDAEILQSVIRGDDLGDDRDQDEDGRVIEELAGNLAALNF